VGSAVQGNRRVIVVISGLNSEAERAEEAERLVNWAFRQFIQRTVLKADARLTDTQVWLGDAHRVGLVAGEDVNLLVPAVLQGEISATVEYETPVTAPVTKGQPLGELVINMPDMEQVRVPLLAENDVAKGGFLPRLRTAATVLFEKINSEAAGL
jgi:D-alanyl-D-alanine carboxypeptidase (penicillin-binding protein 5/6)